MGMSGSNAYCQQPRAAEKVVYVQENNEGEAGCSISTLELPRCEMNGQDAKRPARVLAQFRTLSRLELRGQGSLQESRRGRMLQRCYRRRIVPSGLTTHCISLQRGVLTVTSEP